MPTGYITQFTEADYSILFDNELREARLISGDATTGTLQRPGSSIHIVATGSGATYDNTPTYDSGEHLTSGTINQFDFYQGTTLIMSVSGLSLSAVDFDNALYAWQANGNPDPFKTEFDVYAIDYDGTNLPTGAEGGGYGSDNADTFTFGAGDYYVTLGAGNDVIYAGTTSVFTQLSYANADTGNGIIANWLTGTINDPYGNTDTFTGRVDSLRGTNEADQFIGDDQDNQIRGLGGNDTFNAGDGVDEIRYDRDATYGGLGGVNVNLATGTATDGFGDTDTFTSVERVRGTDMDDILIGNDDDNRLRGLGGDDTLSGAGGNDLLEGGDGNDVLDGGAGDDILSLGDGDEGGILGSIGNDTINIDGTNDVFFDYERLNASITFQIGSSTATVNKGANGTDTVSGLDGIDYENGGYNFEGGSAGDSFVINGAVDQFGIVSGRQGDDSFSNIGAGAVRVDYREDGDDTHSGITYTSNNGSKISGTVTGAGTGTDTLSNIDQIRGTDYNDVFNGGDGDEIFILRGGNDTVNGGGGMDLVRFDRNGMGGVEVDLSVGVAVGTFNGNAFSHTLTNVERINGSRDQIDRIFGSDADEGFAGRGGNDVLVGRGGDDELYGEDGNDLLNGNDGDDHLEGGNGADTLNGGAGNDYLDGGAGNDTLNLGTGDEGYVQGSTGNDIINIQGTIDSKFDYGWLDLATNFQIGAATATVDKGTGGTDTVNGLDRINYEDGGYNFEGTSMGDSFVINGAADQYGSIKTNGGNDTITNSGAGFVRADYHGGFEDGVYPLFSSITYTSNNGAKVSGTVTGSFTGTDTLTNIDEIRGTDLNDTFNGGDGDERFILRGGNDVVNGGGGTDMVRFDRSGIGAVDVDLEAGTATGMHNGNAFSHTLSNIEIIRGSRADNDRIFGSNANETFYGRGGNDVLNGREGDDDLNGEDGNDIMNGGEGADRMAGGRGNDVYYVDNAGDTIVENTSEGMDHVFSFISLALRDKSQNLENLSLLGTGDTSGTGNGLSNTITGNSGNNVLNGAFGDDVLIGGLGNDIFLDDTGADRMVGGGGNDVYYVDDAGDVIEEYAGGGTDMVFSYISLALRDQSQYLENLQLLGTGNTSGTGNGLANTITGNSGNNILNGAFGDDVLFGGLGNDIFKDDIGADRMVGGGGNDVYYVDDAGDRVEENDGGGTDLVYSYIDFALRDHSQYLENLQLLGTGNTRGTGNGLVNNITGNSGNNVLNGGGGDDTLRGGAGNDIFLDNAGADHMIGGVGNDVYYVDNLGDTIEEYAGGGIDRVFSYTSYALRDNSQYLENLNLLGNQNTSGTGNGLSNTIVGNSANNILNGAFGNDVLIGGAGDDAFLDDSGDDRFTGGVGNDVFIFRNAGEHDVITDFENGVDVIRIGGLGVTTFADITHSQQGADTLLSFGGTEVTLLDFDDSLISADDFQFV
ncbi:beta strand repeat-containing protein [Cohaesibacter intestini]|uniref:beta strand repeat-containing protein n=1 Tax=Cohaesibacter intestini TaxID=2211145 RepID=UPI000DEBC11A|nr:calcium-binding protein [Cohaesibacter intestini]